MVREWLREGDGVLGSRRLLSEFSLTLLSDQPTNCQQKKRNLRRRKSRWFDCPRSSGNRLLDAGKIEFYTNRKIWGPGRLVWPPVVSQFSIVPTPSQLWLGNYLYQIFMPPYFIKQSMNNIRRSSGEESVWIGTVGLRALPWWKIWPGSSSLKFTS